MGNGRNSRDIANVASCLETDAQIQRTRLASTFGLLAGLLLTFVNLSFGDDRSGIAIYTTLDHGRDETAVAVPFMAATRFALVTQVTTLDGRSLRVTNNQIKELVYPPDLTSATIVDEAGIAALRGTLADLQALQERFPRTHGQLAPHINELGRVVRLLEEGNVLVTGRLLSRDDYETEAAAIRAAAVDLHVGGVIYKGTKLMSVSGEKISIMHSGGGMSLGSLKQGGDQ